MILISVAKPNSGSMINGRMRTYATATVNLLPSRMTREQYRASHTLVSVLSTQYPKQTRTFTLIAGCFVVIFFAAVTGIMWRERLR